MTGTGPDQGSQETPGCVSDPAPRLTNHITDLTKIEFISPTIVGSGNWLKNRSYLVIKKDGAGQTFDVPVYAPANSRLTGVTYYLQPMLNENDQWVDVAQYDLRFQVSCEVSYGFDHLWRLVGDIAAVAADEPATSTRNASVKADVAVQAGDLIGYTTGTILAHTWDFILTNSTLQNRFVNQERYENTGDLQSLLMADCPYDYFNDAMSAEYYALLGGFGGITEDGTCDMSPDVPGTVAGGWFLEPFSMETSSGPGVGWALSVVTGADGYIAISGEQTRVIVNPEHPTYADPKNVTAEHCYEHRSHPVGFVYLKLLSDTRLAVAFGDGTCPPQLPGGYRTFYR